MPYYAERALLRDDISNNDEIECSALILRLSITDTRLMRCCRRCRRAFDNDHDACARAVVLSRQDDTAVRGVMRYAMLLLRDARRLLR